MKTAIDKDYTFTGKVGNILLEILVRNIPFAALPRHRKPKMIDQNAELHTNKPTVIRQTFAANLSSRATFTVGMQQLQTYGVRYPKQAKCGEELVRQLPVLGKEPEEPGPFRKPGKEMPPFPRTPSVELTISLALECKEHTKGYDLAGTKFRQGFSFFSTDLVIDPAEQLNDKGLSFHGSLPSR